MYNNRCVLWKELHITLQKNYTILVYLLGRKKEKIWSGSRIHREVKRNVGGHQSQNETTQ